MENKNKPSEIFCITKDQDGNIKDVGTWGNWFPSLSEEEKNKFIDKEKYPISMPKQIFIDMIRSIEKEDSYNVPIQTPDGTKIYIINDKYLRTDGDTSKNSDLLDLPGPEHLRTADGTNNKYFNLLRYLTGK